MAEPELIFEEWTDETDLPAQDLPQESTRADTPQPDVDENSQAAAPAWFQKKQAAPEQSATNSAAQSAAKPVRKVVKKRRLRKILGPKIQVAEEPEEELDWKEQLKEWFEQARASLGVSLCVHSLMLLILALIALGDDDQTMDLGLTGTEGVELNEEEFMEIGQFDVEEDSDSSPSELAATDQMVFEDTDGLSNPVGLTFNPGGVFAGDGDGNGEKGIGKALSLKPGKNAVIQGSFTAWTVPEDPLPGQNYRIFIRVKVPKELRKYPLSDLQGSFVIGTDGYFKTIPDRPAIGQVRNTYARVEKGEVTLSVDIPGAAQLVKDTIKIESRILKEKQELEITF